jgi:poly(beta-D-mannuronate) lyase
MTALALLVALATTADRRLDSLAALQARVDAARPGEVIVVKNGEYTTSAPIVVSARGEAGKPIRIAAETPGGVTLRGTDGFDVAAGAAHVVIDGFVFAHQSGRTQIRSGASHIRFTHVVFMCTGDGAYLTIAGDDTEIDRSEFRDKRTVGNMIDVRGAGSQIAQRVHIHDNYFHDFTSPGPGTNGAETIRFGLSGLSLSKGLGVIERNLFVRCTGENEMLSIKSGSNIIQDNTLLDSPGAQLTLRHGNGNIVEANTGAIQIGNGGAEVADGAPLTSHDRPDETYVTSNILVNNTRNIFMTRRDQGLGATKATVAHNIIRGGGPAAYIDGPFPDAIWRDNVVLQTTLGLMPPDGSVEKKVDIRVPRPLSAERMLELIRRR